MGNSLNLENPNVLVSQKQRSEDTKLALLRTRSTHVMSRLDEYDEAALKSAVRDQQIERDLVLNEHLNNACYEQEWSEEQLWMARYNRAFDLARDRDYTWDEAEAYANDLADVAVSRMDDQLQNTIWNLYSKNGDHSRNMNQIKMIKVQCRYHKRLL